MSIALLLGGVVLGLLASPAAAVKRRAFATSIKGNGNIASWPGATGASALAKADSVCRARAQVAGLPNAATYRAWLSVTGNDAYCHVQGLGGTVENRCNNASPMPGAGPWFLTNGITSFTGTLDQLVGPPRLIYRPVMLDELGNQIDEVDHEVWTGTSPTGEKTLTCNDWTTTDSSIDGQTGDALGTASLWTARSERQCGDNYRLLCVEPGESETTFLHWSPGAIVFTTSATGKGDLGSWPEAQGATGVNAGFAICRTLAAKAGLPSPGSFVPWISTPLVDARDRLTTDGPFKRVDGFIVANDLDDLVDGTIDTGLHVFEDGSYLTNAEDFGHLVFTGTTGDGLVSGNPCDYWTNGTNNWQARDGSSAMGLTDRWTALGSAFCSMDFHLYCFSNRITVFWDGFESGGFARWHKKFP